MNRALVLEDVAQLSHHVAHATGERRRVLAAEMRIRLGRLDANHPHVRAMLDDIERIERAA